MNIFGKVNYFGFDISEVYYVLEYLLFLFIQIEEVVDYFYIE